MPYSNQQAWRDFAQPTMGGSYDRHGQQIKNDSKAQDENSFWSQPSGVVHIGTHRIDLGFRVFMFKER